MAAPLQQETEIILDDSQAARVGDGATAAVPSPCTTALSALAGEVDEPVDPRTIDLQDVLSRQLEAIQTRLHENFCQTARLVCTQQEFYTKLEATNVELAAENTMLREKLLAAGLNAGDLCEQSTGGTGETGISRIHLSGTMQKEQHQPPSLLFGAPMLRAAPAAGVPIVAPAEGQFFSAVLPVLPGTVGSDGVHASLTTPETAPPKLIPSETEDPDPLKKPERRPSDASRRSKDASKKSKAKQDDTKHENQHGSSDGHAADEDDRKPSRTTKAANKRAVFADAAALKEKVKNNLTKPEYNVAMFYHEKGIFQQIARHQLFDNFTLCVIGINAIWISIDTDYNTAATPLDALPVFQVGENLFCAYFSFEWFVRFMSFRRKRDGCRDAWFVFDTSLVSIMVFETWVMPIVLLASGMGSGGALGNAGILKLLRLMRLSRMARMARLLRALPELLILVKGLAVAMRSVLFTLVFLVAIVYVFAVAMVQLLGPRGVFEGTQVGEDRFAHVSMAMNELLLGAALPDQADIINEVLQINVVLYVIILLFMMLAGITIMNMLVGVLCEVVSVVSSVEKETLLLNYVKMQLQDMLQNSDMDKDGDGMISKVEFQALLGNPDAAKAFAEIGVDVVGLIDFTDYIFQDGRALSFPAFMDVVLQLRGSNTATVKDMVDLRKCITFELRKMLRPEEFEDEYSNE